LLSLLTSSALGDPEERNGFVRALPAQHASEMSGPAPLPVIKTSQGPQVGPYIFGKTLGSGSTGKVKLVSTRGLPMYSSACFALFLRAKKKVVLVA
jgi:hypothetical protein